MPYWGDHYTRSLARSKIKNTKPCKTTALLPKKSQACVFQLYLIQRHALETQEQMWQSYHYKLTYSDVLCNPSSPEMQGKKWVCLKKMSCLWISHLVRITAIDRICWSLGETPVGSRSKPIFSELPQFNIKHIFLSFTVRKIPQWCGIAHSLLSKDMKKSLVRVSIQVLCLFWNTIPVCAFISSSFFEKKNQQNTTTQNVI